MLINGSDHLLKTLNPLTIVYILNQYLKTYLQNNSLSLYTKQLKITF